MKSKKAVSEAQKRASRKWDAANKEKKDKSRTKSGCKKYINVYATLEDLEEVRLWIKDRANQKAVRQRHDYPLRGLIYCECGQKMYGYTDTRYPSNSRYRCKKCNNAIKKEALEKYIMSVARNYILDNADVLVDKIEQETKKALESLDTDKNALKKRLDEIDKEENNCVEYVMSFGANEKIIKEAEKKPNE